MKKIILSFVLIFSLLMSFSACKNGGSKDDKTPEETVYSVLDRLAKNDYSEIELTTTVKNGDIELTAKYVLTDTSVTYVVEQMSMLPVDGVLDNVSATDKIVLSGTATVKDGTVLTLDGASVNMPEYDELKGAFNFKEDYFSNVKEDSGKFSADVISPADFLGTTKVLANLKVEVEYNSNAITKLTLVYKTANSTVTTVYLFKK